MSEPTLTVSPWSAWRETGAEPWNLRRVVHLHRRAGFAATWDELQRDLKDGPRAAIDRLLAGKAYTRGVPDDFDAISRVIGDAAVAASHANRLKAWSLYRMIFSPDPLRERLTLMWHNHFATSNLKVNDVAGMRQQNEIFREYAKAPFGELLPRVVKDPAMLVWLDAQANRKEHPNENLARELMEVFTLGVGNFSEKDVKEAARALTGWSIKNGAFHEVSAYRDAGEKTILGQAGKYRGDDVLKLLLEHPATSVRLARRIGELLMGEGVVEDAAINELAALLREHNLDFGWGVETALRSKLFFSDKNIGNRVLGPLEYMVGAVRALEVFDPPPSTLVLAEWSARLGQDLFYPPNVFGWEGGRAWINTRSMIGRTNFAAALVDGRLTAGGGGSARGASPFDAVALARRHGRDAGEAMAYFCSLWFGAADRKMIERIEQAAGIAGGKPTPDQLRSAVNIMLMQPEAQLG